MNKTALNISIVIAAILIASIGMEMMVRIFLPQGRLVTWLEMHDRGFMMNRKGGEALHEFNDRRIVYRFNDKRLRAEEISSDFNILAMGDSFTFGLLLEEEDTFIGQINRKLENSDIGNVRFLNGGIGGSGTADILAWLEYFGPDVQPDVVMLFLNNDDIDRSISKNLYVAMEVEDEIVLIPSRRWKPTTFQKLFHHRKMYQLLQKHSQLMNIAVKVFWRYLYFNDTLNNFEKVNPELPVPTREVFTAETDYGAVLGTALIREINNWCIENNCDLIVTNTGFFLDEMVSFHTARFMNVMDEFSENNGFSYFNITKCVSSRVEGDFDSIIIPGDSHPNERGASVIADCVWDWFNPWLQLKLRDGGYEN